MTDSEREGSAPRSGGGAIGKGRAELGADVVIIGGGLIALASAAALAARGATIRLIAVHEAGEASRAAAGMLAPGVERATGAQRAVPELPRRAHRADRSSRPAQSRRGD
jgi:glycine/D-amino acid oxidase-like deaminating enzyme